MNKLYNLRDTLCEELEKVAKKESIDTSDLDIIDKLAHSIKNIDKIISGESEGYSMGSYDSYNRGGSYGGSYNRSYDGGSYDSSYDRSYGGSYARRGRDGDGDGRYNESRESRNSRGYSRDEEKMKERLRRMMSEASNENERATIMRCLEQLDMM